MPVHRKVAKLIGVDPDRSVHTNPYLDEAYQCTLEEFARSATIKVDAIYSVFVLEHVDQPKEFLSACRGLLKKQGMLFAVTPNLWHYFGTVARVSSQLRIEDWLLRRLRGAAEVEDYHFPTRYRMNSVRALKRGLLSSGFTAVEFRCFDNPQLVEAYFRRLPLIRSVPIVYSRSVYALRLPSFMGMLMFKAIC